MKDHTKSKMVMSEAPGGHALITMVFAERIDDDDVVLARIARISSDAVATEVVPMTHAGFAGFLTRHPTARLPYATFGSYPYPRRD